MREAAGEVLGQAGEAHEALEARRWGVERLANHHQPSHPKSPENGNASKTQVPGSPERLLVGLAGPPDPTLQRVK